MRYKAYNLVFFALVFQFTLAVYGETELTKAIKSQDYSLVENLLKKGQKKPDNESIEAAIAGKNQDIKNLVLNFQDSSGGTALMSLLYQVRENKNPEAKALAIKIINAGAKLDLKKNDGTTTAEFVKWANDPEITNAYETKHKEEKAVEPKIERKCSAGESLLKTGKCEKTLADTIGAAVVGAKYRFTNKDGLTEGAEELKKLGTHVIKLFLTPNHKTEDITFYNDWSSGINSLTSLAKEKIIKDVLADEWWHTVILVANDFSIGGWGGWRDGMNPEKTAKVKKEFSDLTKWLIENFKDQPRIFILQNWESDNALYDYGNNKEDQIAIEGFTDYLNARMDGIIDARGNNTNELKVMGAMEVNTISVDKWKDKDTGKVLDKSVDVIVPKTHFDLYSYSDYETNNYWYKNTWKEQLKKNLNKLAEKAPNDKTFGMGNKNIFIGEFAWGENKSSSSNQLEFVKGTTEAALEWGVQYLMYWALYDNEWAEDIVQGKRPAPEISPPTKMPKNTDMVGHYLIRPDGSKSNIWEYFHKLFTKK